MRLFLFFLLTILPISAKAAWIVKSDFQLSLTESLFDKIIQDFWQTLQGTQEMDIADFTITPSGIPIQIQGIHAQVNYAFPLPTRVDERTREWALSTQDLNARLTINHISATQIIEREVDGIIVRVRLEANCNNVVLTLPQGTTHVAAKIKAEVIDNQVKLTMPSYEAEWAANAWTVESMQCSGVEGFDQIVRTEALKALSTFQNFDAQVRAALTENFLQWSKDASLLLLSERELPTGKDYLKVYYMPSAAVESGTGLLLSGELRFEYPYVSPDQTIENSYKLDAPAPTAKASTTVPQLLLPFATIRSLMMGEYFAGQLEYSLYSNEIPAFTSFMQSRWDQFWAWPDLQRYPKDTKFAFQFLPMGPPAMGTGKAAGTNAISTEISLPLSVRMFAPLENKYRPMVEFRTMISGPSTLTLLKTGKIQFRLSSQAYPVTYAFADAYVKKYNPSKKISADTIATKVRAALNTEGFDLSMPTLTVGAALELVPAGWALQGQNVRLDFTTK